jgi:hypothetical protein
LRGTHRTRLAERIQQQQEANMKFPAGATKFMVFCLAIGGADAQGLSPSQSFPDYKGQRLEIVGDNGPGSSAVSANSATGLRSLTSVPMYPVLYCGAAGGGTDEYPVTAGPGLVRWLLEVPAPPAGGKMYDVRYEVYDNIAAVSFFSKILLEKVDDDHISITAQAYPSCAGARVRLKVTASYAK